MAIAETKLLGPADELFADGPARRRFEGLLEGDDLAHLLEKPDIDVGGLVDGFDGEPNAKAIGDVPKPVRQGSPNQVENRLSELLVGGVGQVCQHGLGGVDRLTGLDESAHLGGEVSVVGLREE